MVTGPAGSGKTTLLAQCHATESCAAWLSVESVDNDPVAFWLGMITALRSVWWDFGAAYRDRLGAAGPGVVDDIVTLVCNELAERQAPVHLFLDDVHVIDNVASLRSLHRFLGAVPLHVRVTIASRRSAPVPLARLRANGDLVEIDASDLKLSPSEARQLLSPFVTSLDQTEIDLLVDRTEGWAVGLRLAGLAAAGSADAHALVEGFRGTDRDVADYLLSEVLGSLSDDERRFLLETSILDELTGDLCDAVAARTGSAGLLIDLDRANALVIPLDRDDRWFRYHHMLGELLTAELRRTRPDDECRLHRRAFEWMRDHGNIEAAVRHGLAADEADAAADLLCEKWAGMMHSGRTETLRVLIARFPPGIVEGHQPLAMAAAGVNAMAGHATTARRWLRAAERATYSGPRPDGIANTASSVALTRGTLALDGIDAALADGRTALELEPEGSPARSLAATLVGRSLVIRGDIDASKEHLEEVVRLGGTNLRAYAMAELALGQLGRGDAEGALRDAHAASELLHDAGGDDLFMAATAHAVTALAAIALGDAGTARTALAAARRPMAAVGQAMPLDATHTRLLLARASLALDDVDTAGVLLRDAQQVLDSVEDVGVMRAQHGELVAQLNRMQPRVEADAVDELTERELEVLGLLPSPLTIREIAEELFVSRNTVKTHTRRVYRKLSASSRDEAVLIARDRGLLETLDGSGPEPE